MVHWGIKDESDTPPGLTVLRIIARSVDNKQERDRV